MSPSINDSLTTYGLLPETLSFLLFLNPILTAYVTTTTSPPPIWSTTRGTCCELCARSWINLTYHHLIPKSVHAKVLKRGWHEEWELNKVAWLCRACHSFVHRVATNEELARDFYSVELLSEREDVARFVGWVGNVRWKSR
jgi:5-methylcytosine-specific restriction endonuclease McrA